MLERTQRSGENAGSVPPPLLDVQILSVATANPGFRVDQSHAAKSARIVYPHLESLWSLYETCGIETRYSCEPHEWYLQPRSWDERTRSFQKHALDLLERVTVDAINASDIEIGEIDMIVTNTITGLAIPSLDAKLLNRLPFSNKIERLPIFGLGCGEESEAWPARLAWRKECRAPMCSSSRSTYAASACA